MTNLPQGDSASTGRDRRQAAMPFILITVLIDMMAIGVIVPVLPLLVGTFTTNTTEQTFWFGVVTLSFGVANFFASPILGGLSDRYGRRPVLLLGFSGLALSFLVTGLATALWMLIVVRIFSGAMQANAAVANAYVADISAPEDRARRFGLVGAMFGVGFTLGPVLGGVLGSINLHLPFFVAGGLAITNWLYGWFVLPESLPPDRRTAFKWSRANPLGALKGLRQLEGVGPLVVVIGLASLAQFTLHNSFVLYTTFKFGWGPAQNGWALFTVGL
ncbi:MAG: MFS transporter, partial [Burkholderiales bacterium PBB5]